ncbi:MAG: hypothetical protein ACKON9_02725 [Planctomycetaceae bacterium]
MSSSEKGGGRVAVQLSDQQMDLLLRDFFACEVPGALPVAGRVVPQLRRYPEVSERAAVRPAAVIRSARLAAALALAALALCALLLNRDAERVATVAAKAKAAAAEETMLVSPQGSAGSRQVPVGADGLLLQETDQIQLAPQR